MRNPGMIVIGSVVFVLGLLLTTDLVEWLLNMVGILTMVAGVVVFAAGVWNAMRSRG
jgi:hypothetical protein